MNKEQFISCIFVKNPLWDQKDPQHHNRYVLDKLWDGVPEEMKSTSKYILKFIIFLSKIHRLYFILTNKHLVCFPNNNRSFSWSVILSRSGNILRVR